MPELSVSGVSIKGISAAVPSNREDNSIIESISERSKNEIINQVGIRYRHVSDDSTTAADLCLSSAKKLLEELNWSPTEIGLMVFVSQTPDHLVPGSATQLQDKLDLPINCICLDINQGCAGYVYGLSVMSGMMRSFGIKRGLLLVGDTITKIISEEDNSLRPIFADAGTATALEFNIDSKEKMVFRLGSNGSSYQAIYTEDGGFRKPLNENSLKMKSISEGVSRQANQLSMNGQAVFTFGLSTVASEIKALMNSQQITEADVDYLVLHQANQLLNDSIVRKVGFDKSKSPSSLYDFGNTSCATIPITFVTQLRDDLMNNSRTLLLSGFGVGLSWGNVILTTENIVCPKLIYC